MYKIDGITELYVVNPSVLGISKDNIEASDLAAIIDHTYLKPDADRDIIEQICKEAREYKFASVCVNSTMVHLVSKLLEGSGIRTCSVVGFPLGAGTSSSKASETADAIRLGANEIDMVINVGALKSLDYALVEEDIRQVVRAARGNVVKVIIETCLLSRDEKVIACAISKAAGAHFVKTSTGFSTGGASVENVKLMRRVVGAEMGVKASGGIRDAETALAMVKAGASRLGVSSSIAIVSGLKGEGNY